MYTSLRCRRTGDPLLQRLCQHRRLRREEQADGSGCADLEGVLHANPGHPGGGALMILGGHQYSLAECMYQTALLLSSAVYIWMVVYIKGLVLALAL